MNVIFDFAVISLGIFLYIQHFEKEKIPILAGLSSFFY
jgi:hypothetical protein